MEFHEDDSSKGRYGMILGTYLLATLGLKLKLSHDATEAYDRHLKGSTSPMVDLGTYEFKILNTGKITPEE